MECSQTYDIGNREQTSYIQCDIEGDEIHLTYSKLINKKWIIWLMLFGLYTPQYLSEYVIFVSGVTRALRVMSYSLILYGYASSIKKHIHKSFNIALVYLWVELMISTAQSEIASFDSYFGNLKVVFTTCVLIETLAIYSPVNGLHCLYGYFSVCVLINTATVILFPNAMYANAAGNWVCWFLGEDNVGYLFYIVASTLAMVYITYVSKHITMVSCLVWTSAFFFAFYRDIATGKACQIIWAVLVLGYQFGWFRKLLKGRYVLYTFVGSFVVIVLFRGAFLEPIVTALGKEITFSGRTILWDSVLKQIQESPLLGFGMYTNDTFSKVFHTKSWSAHNWMLTLLSNGGIIAVVLFIIMLISSYRDARTYRTSAFYRCIVIGMILVFIRSITESGYLLNFTFMMPAILAYTQEFIQGLECEQIQNKVVIKGIPKLRLSWRYRGRRAC